MNRARLPVIPPLLIDNALVLNCIEKSKHFVKFFSKQCQPIANNSVLPPFNFLTAQRLVSVLFEEANILSLIRNLNPNKATGPDEISAHMLLLSDVSIVLPLKIIYLNILNTSIYPDLWKQVNVTQIHKKDNKKLVHNYRSISLLPICGKIFEKLISDCLYT